MKEEEEYNQMLRIQQEEENKSPYKALSYKD
jgi:hypothetical protein